MIIEDGMEKCIQQCIIGRVQGRRQKVGVMFGTIDTSNRIKIGWSRANINAGDRFNLEKGLALAEQRSFAKTPIKAPRSIQNNLERFAKRCNRYFKNNDGIYANWW
jgi:hypothetical protein